MGDDHAERKPPGGGGQRAKRAGGGGGRYEEAAPASKCRGRKESPFLLFHVKLIYLNNILSTTYNFLRGLELIIRLSIYSDLFFTHLSKSIARSESLTVIGWFLPV